MAPMDQLYTKSNMTIKYANKIPQKGMFSLKWTGAVGYRCSFSDSLHHPFIRFLYLSAGWTKAGRGGNMFRNVCRDNRVQKVYIYIYAENRPQTPTSTTENGITRVHLTETTTTTTMMMIKMMNDPDADLLASCEMKLILMLMMMLMMMMMMMMK